MRRSLSLIAAALVLSGLVPGGARASDDTETRLRDALRSAIAQSRTLEDERAQLHAKNAENQKLIEALKAQLESRPAPGRTAAAPDRAILDRMEAEFNRRLAANSETVAQAIAAQEKWKSAYQEAVAVARAKEAERAQLAGQTETLTRRAESCETKNAALYKVGAEILDRYAARDIAETLLDRDPFLGIKKVELQTLVQDYQDKLLDQKAVP
ncbi:hypothetical protein [Magnetospirillum fulvum]|uniref:Uncharacterized protein n=1 Tax=Magnetospirillum fulvum TaxID=1082 RepID=A0A1H6HAV8_MAGFU|nr:hypothetical protein [Magnetospirillum fulvum]SEH32931.1 hypothetical protein SAMN04244559_01361 [Magnetospirillum fulvum]